MNLTDVYRLFHPKTAHYAFFSAAHGTLSKIDHISGPKASLSKYKKDRNSPLHSICSHRSVHIVLALKLELNNKTNSRKYANN
jgi:hypothetical protein